MFMKLLCSVRGHPNRILGIMHTEFGMIWGMRCVRCKHVFFPDEAGLKMWHKTSNKNLEIEWRVEDAK